MSGLLGISGASLVVPSLVAFFLIDHHAAQGLAMGVALADSTAGAATHWRGRNIDYRVLLYLAPPALVAAVAGAFLSHSLSDSVLRNVFGAFMVTVSVVMLLRLTKGSARRQAPPPGHHTITEEAPGPADLPTSSGVNGTGSG